MPLAHASTTLTARGTWTVTSLSPPAILKTFDGYVLLTQSYVLSIQGDLTGQYAGTDIALLNTSTGFAAYKGTATFTGTILNVGSGTLASIWAGTTNNFPSIQAAITLNHGTEGLANVVGFGQVTGTYGVSGSYTFTINTH